jgi:hypothetical protein
VRVRSWGCGSLTHSSISSIIVTASAAADKTRYHNHNTNTNTKKTHMDM